MTRSFSLTVDTFVDDVLHHIDDDELLAEIESRGLTFESGNSETVTELITAIWMKQRTGLDYKQELDLLIYEVIGKII